METQSITIAKLNDRFRREGFGFVLTRGIRDIGDVDAVIRRVRSFYKFDEGNDPYDEHDFGSFTMFGEKIFWKIDYLDNELGNWYDPFLPECRRVLTVMLAEEY